LTSYLHGVYDLSEYQEQVPVVVEESHNPLTRHDDAWAALIGAKKEREKGFSVNHDSSLSTTRR